MADAVYGTSVLYGLPLADVSLQVSIDIEKYRACYGPLREDLSTIIAQVPVGSALQVKVSSALCDPVCHIAREDRTIYYDDDHLSNYGVSLILPRVTQPVQIILNC